MKLNNPEFRELLGEIAGLQKKVNRLRLPLITGGQVFSVDATIQTMEREEKAKLEEEEAKAQLDVASSPISDTSDK